MLAALTQAAVDEHIKQLQEGAEGKSRRRRVALRTACDLLKVMLKVNPHHRIHNLSDFGAKFLDATYNATGTTVIRQEIHAAKDAVLARIDDVHRLVVKIEERTVALAGLPDALQGDMRRCLQAVEGIAGQVSGLRQLMAQLHNSDCPGLFVVLPDVPPAKLSVLRILGDGLIAAPDTVGRLKEGFEAGSSPADAFAVAADTFGRLTEMFETTRAAQWYCKHFVGRKLRLKLVCGKCACPQGDGYLIQAPAETLQKLAPALQVRGLRTCSAHATRRMLDALFAVGHFIHFIHFITTSLLHTASRHEDVGMSLAPACGDARSV